jgi:hypothetical protein
MVYYYKILSWKTAIGNRCDGPTLGVLRDGIRQNMYFISSLAFYYSVFMKWPVALGLAGKGFRFAPNCLSINLPT